MRYGFFNSLLVEPAQHRRRRGEPTDEQRAEAREILLNIRQRKNIREGRTPNFTRGPRAHKGAPIKVVFRRRKP